MAVNKIIGLLSSLVFITNTSGQTISSNQMAKLVNKEILPYKTKEGKYMGCDYTFECMGMKIIFYNVVIDKNKISIKGRAVDSRDSSGAYHANIFLGQPSGETLKNVKNLFFTYTRTESDSTKDNFPHRSGDFIIETTFGPKDRLYFVHVLYKPLEYNIGKLLTK